MVEVVGVGVVTKARHPSLCRQHRRGREPQERWRPPEPLSTPLFVDTAPRRSLARARPIRLVRAPACSCHPRSCAFPANGLAHHAPRRIHAIAVVVVSYSAKLAPNVPSSLAAPTMSAVAAAVAVRRKMSGRKKPVALRLIHLTHWVAEWPGPPCLGCAGSHLPLSVHRSAGCSAQVALRRLFPEMSGVI
jgi:hypothetical protein